MEVDVDMVTPTVSMPVYLAARVFFNESLRGRRFDGQATVGIDADGYAIVATTRRWNAPPHVACIKGVLGDAVRFEHGITRPAWRFRRGWKLYMRAVLSW